MTAHNGRGIWMRVIALIAIGFGLMTIREGGAVLFNFLAGFAYVIAGVGLWMRRRWATWLAMAIAVATALVFLAFGVHVALGGAWERRTVIAMTLRTLVWVGIAAIAWRRSTANAPATREQ